MPLSIGGKSKFMRHEAREPRTVKNIMMKSKEVYGFIGLSSGGNRGFLEDGDLRGRTPALTAGTDKMNWWWGSCFAKNAV